VRYLYPPREYLAGVGLAQQLPVNAGAVLNASEDLFRDLVREIARMEVNILVANIYTERLKDLETYNIELSEAGPLEGVEYSVDVEIPVCHRYYGNNHGTISVVSKYKYLLLGVKCKGSPRLYDYVMGAGSYLLHTSKLVTTLEDEYNLYRKLVITPNEAYNLYKLLYKELGTGARPLLELAKKAEQAGDREVAGILRKLYALLETSKDIIEEIEQADYSQVVSKIASEMVERRVEEAVELLRQAKEAAKRGDIEELEVLLGTGLFKTPTPEIITITLRDIIDYLSREAGETIADHMLWRGFSKIIEEEIAEIITAEVMKRIDILDALITAAEHFGLYVD